MTYSSDGNPDLELDCAAVMADIWLILDNECSDDARARLQAHIDGCSKCLAHYGVEEQLKSLINRKCGGDRAPDGLRERISLTFTKTEITTYRREQ